MKKPVPLFALLLLVGSSFVQPQSKKINGKVVSFGESFPLEGVRVEIKGRDMVKGTMADGSFSLGIEPKDEFLVVSLNYFSFSSISNHKQFGYSCAGSVYSRLCFAHDLD